MRLIIPWVTNAHNLLPSHVINTLSDQSPCTPSRPHRRSRIRARHPFSFCDELLLELRFCDAARRCARVTNAT